MGSAVGVATKASVDATISAVVEGEGVGVGEGGDMVLLSVVCAGGAGFIFDVFIGSCKGTSLEGNGLEAPR